MSRSFYPRVERLGYMLVGSFIAATGVIVFVFFGSMMRRERVDAFGAFLWLLLIVICGFFVRVGWVYLHKGLREVRK